MYGTVARLRVRPGKEQELLAHGERWSRERGPNSGQVAGYLFKLDDRPDEFMMVAVFRDRESYRQNASAPETDRLYREMRELLQSDPEWNDGEAFELPTLAGI